MFGRHRVRNTSKSNERNVKQELEEVFRKLATDVNERHVLMSIGNDLFPRDRKEYPTKMASAEHYEHLTKSLVVYCREVDAAFMKKANSRGLRSFLRSASTKGDDILKQIDEAREMLQQYETQNDGLKTMIYEQVNLRLELRERQRQHRQELEKEKAAFGENKQTTVLRTPIRILARPKPSTDEEESEEVADNNKSIPVVSEEQPLDTTLAHLTKNIVMKVLPKFGEKHWKIIQIRQDVVIAKELYLLRDKVLTKIIEKMRNKKMPQMSIRNTDLADLYHSYVKKHGLPARIAQQELERSPAEVHFIFKHFAAFKQNNNNGGKRKVVTR